MKRLILVLVSTLLLAVFIAFNYLLWEREGREEKLRQLENNNASNSASMNTLNREIKNLEEENSNLEKDINELKNLNLSLQSDVQKQKEDKATALNEVYSRNELIDVLKKLLNTSTFEEMMKKWVESIDLQKYEEAYKLEYGWKSSEEKKISLEEYTSQYKNTLKSLKFKSLKIDTDQSTTASGEVSLILIVEAKLIDEADTSKSIFVNDENKKLVKLKLLNEKEGFVIESMSDIK